MAALNRDALEEVFLHCAPPDLLAMRQTCGAAADLLGRSEKVWLAKLRESFGLSLKVRGLPGRICGCSEETIRRDLEQQLKHAAPVRMLAQPPPICPCRTTPMQQAPAGGDDGLFVRLARRVYEASQGQALRFQGVYVGGGVDEVRWGGGGGPALGAAGWGACCDCITCLACPPCRPRHPPDHLP